MKLIKEKLSSGDKLIKFELTLDGSSDIPSVSYASMYRPLSWVRSTGRQGIGLLALRPDFDLLSLTTLSIGVSKFKVPLRSHPKDCLSKATAADIETKLRNLVINNFENTTVDFSALRSSESVCNQHILDVDGSASFSYYCCRFDETERTVCDYLEKDKWIGILLVTITILKIVVALFVPNLVPETLYRKKFIAEPYVLNLKQSLKLSMVVTRSPEQYTNARNVKRMSEIQSMKSFADTVHSIQEDEPTELKINRLDFHVKRQRIQSAKYAPVGLFKTMYNSFFRCEIRKRRSVKECCDARICVKCCGHHGITWYKALSEMMSIAAWFVIALPWILRVYVYYKFEADETERRKAFADEKSLKYAFSGNFTLYLSPLHVVFIVIYAILVLESCVYGVIRKEAQERLKLVVRKSLRDLKEVKKMLVIGWFVRLSLKPFVWYGVFGLFVGIFSWIVFFPILLIVSAFYLLPTVNVTFRLLAHFAVYIVPQDFCSSNRLSEFLSTIEKKLEMEEISAMEKLEKPDQILKSLGRRLQQVFVILLCLISLYSVIFLITELVAFVVEIFVYTLMGLIVNANTTMTYVSLFLLVWAYGVSVFGTVRKKFLTFNTTLNESVSRLGQEETSEHLKKPQSEQGNASFIVQTDRVDVVNDPVELVTGSGGQLRWKVSRMLLFLNSEDEAFIPTSFFFKACQLPFYGVPGELLISYLKAFLEFGSIIVFLFFVLIVVLAFGDTYELSATNRTLATIAGGFVPYMLKEFLFKPQAPPALDTASVAFQVCLDQAIDDYQQSWVVEDISVEEKQPFVGNLTTQPAEDDKKSAIIAVNLVNETDQPSAGASMAEEADDDVVAETSLSLSHTLKKKKESNQLDLLIILPGNKSDSNFTILDDIIDSKDNIRMAQM